MSTANSSIAVTPGIGVLVASQTALTKEHQVYVLADQAGNLDPVRRILSAAPASSDILAGASAAAAAATGLVTFMTIPAGRTWYGSVNISMSVTATTAIHTRIDVTGAGGVPTGTILRCTCVGAGGSNQVSQPLYIAATAGAVTLQIASSAASTGSLVYASASGVLL